MPLNHPETIPLPDLWEKSSSTKSVPGTKKKVGELLLYKALFFFFPIPSLPTEAEGIISPALQMTELGQKTSSLLSEFPTGWYWQVDLNSGLTDRKSLSPQSGVPNLGSWRSEVTGMDARVSSTIMILPD